MQNQERENVDEEPSYRFQNLSRRKLIAIAAGAEVLPVLGSRKHLWDLVGLDAEAHAEGSVNERRKMQNIPQLKNEQQTDAYLKRAFGVDRNHLSGIVKPLTDFRDLNLKNVDFSHADLRGTNFSGCRLSGAKFDEAKLQGAKFSDAGVGYVTFTNAHLEAADFSRAGLIQTSFKGAELSSKAYEINGKTYQKQTTFDLLRSSETNFQDANLVGVSFLYAILTGANFQGATFGQVKFGDVTQGVSQVYRTDFSWAFMTRAVLNGDLQGDRSSSWEIST